MTHSLMLDKDNNYHGNQITGMKNFNPFGIKTCSNYTVGEIYINKLFLLLIILIFIHQNLLFF
jgi:hypothetical protein